jgi:non-ribosomal peptide synthetase component E (peptide arylation enzyme)
MLSVHARLSPNGVGARDLERSMTFAQWNDRSCRLANALIGLGLSKGDASNGAKSLPPRQRPALWRCPSIFD